VGLCVLVSGSKRGQKKIKKTTLIDDIINMEREHIRHIEFSPYLDGPTFTLDLFDCMRIHRNGPQWQVGYLLKMHDQNGKSTVIFDGSDFGCSPCHAIDSNECVSSIMSFLTLRPGDTDPEYFENYNQVQWDFCMNHSETLEIEVMCQFQENLD